MSRVMYFMLIAKDHSSPPFGMMMMWMVSNASGDNGTYGGDDTDLE